MIDVQLRPFDKRAVGNLLSQAGDTFSSNDRLFIRRVAGRYPFLLQAMAAALLETGGGNRHPRAAKHFYKRVVWHFDDVWDSMDDRARAASVILSLVELGGPVIGQVLTCNDIERADRFSLVLRDMAEQGLAEQVEKDWPFDQEHIVRWQEEQWTMGAQAFTWWVRDVVITEARHVPAYDAWLANQRYRILLTQEKWGQLLNAVRDAYDWATHDIRAMADKIFKVLVRRKE
jgi:hypothetical protein